MIKKNKWKMLITSCVILLPILFGLIYWDKLPEQMVTHWDANWNPDGWSDRRFAVFALPIFILLAHWVCMLCTSKDSKNQNQSKKVFGVLFLICPVTSLVTSTAIYAAALEKTIRPQMLIFLLVGLFFVVIGNYLPKCKQNYTIGIRVKWTMENEENWNATHRFSGKVWAIGGVLMMGCSFFPEDLSLYIFVVLVCVLSILSVGYSYYYFRKEQ